MASHSSPNIPANGDEQQALATEIANRADDSPERIDETDVRSALALIESGQQREDYETAVTAAEVFQNLFDYPDYFEPVFADLIALSDAYPPSIEAIPAPADLCASARLRTVVYVANALCQATQEDPAIAVPHTDSLCDVVFNDENTPRDHVFTLGYAATVDPTGIPVDNLRSRLESLCDRGSGNGYPSFAEATLDALDDAGIDDELSSDVPAESGETLITSIEDGPVFVHDTSSNASDDVLLLDLLGDDFDAGLIDEEGSWRLMGTIEPNVLPNELTSEPKPDIDTSTAETGTDVSVAVPLDCPECDESYGLSTEYPTRAICPSCNRGYFVENTDAEVQHKTNTIVDNGAGQTLDVARIPDIPPASLNDGCSYSELTVGDRIGEGSFAEVHEAWHNDTRLALKQPKMRGTLMESTIERFAEEAQTWTKLDSDPHVVTLLDWGQTPKPWIAMEYLDGGDLRARLDGPDEFNTAERLWVAAVLAETVANVHHLGVRHLDLKPANVLFQQTTGDSWAIPKIGDWGVAKIQLNRDRGDNPLTPSYAAPEQFGSEMLDHQTDIYQLGALCYELLTDCTPTDVGTDASKPTESTQPRPPSALRSDLPERIDEPLLTALAFDRSDRYDRVIYLRDELEAAFHDVVEGTPNARP